MATSAQSKELYFLWYIHVWFFYRKIFWLIALILIYCQEYIFIRLKIIDCQILQKLLCTAAAEQYPWCRIGKFIE